MIKIVENLPQEKEEGEDESDEEDDKDKKEKGSFFKEWIITTSNHLLVV